MVRRATVCSSLLLALLFAPRADGSDGVIEINAARAAAGGVTAGDAPGYPVELYTRGNYRLTSDLVVPGSASSGILVVASGTSIDLNGFTVSSVTTCSGAPPVCTPSGSGIGIDASGADQAVVRNGRVTGFGLFGVDLGSGARARDLTIDNNGVGGIVTDQASLVSDCVVRNNGGAGITTGPDSRIAESIVSGNAGLGISAPFTALSDRNAVNHNVGTGAAGTHGRRYYLTPLTFPGNQALNACAAGFHMAAMWELQSLTLNYDSERAAIPGSDLGTGPPQTGFGGWVRTGGGSSTTNLAGVGNCANWTSPSSSDFGSAASLSSGWTSTTATPHATWPFTGTSLDCAFTAPVWCIED